MKLLLLTLAIVATVYAQTTTPVVDPIYIGSRSMINNDNGATKMCPTYSSAATKIDYPASTGGVLVLHYSADHMCLTGFNTTDGSKISIIVLKCELYDYLYWFSNTDSWSNPSEPMCCGDPTTPVPDYKTIIHTVGCSVVTADVALDTYLLITVYYNWMLQKGLTVPSPYVVQSPASVVTVGFWATIEARYDHLTAVISATATVHAPVGYEGVTVSDARFVLFAGDSYGATDYPGSFAIDDTGTAVVTTQFSPDPVSAEPGHYTIMFILDGIDDYVCPIDFDTWDFFLGMYDPAYWTGDYDAPLVCSYYIQTVPVFPIQNVPCVDRIADYLVSRPFIRTYNHHHPQVDCATGIRDIASEMNVSGRICPLDALTPITVTWTRDLAPSAEPQCDRAVAFGPEDELAASDIISVSVTDGTDNGMGCTYTPGYWKNHADLCDRANARRDVITDMFNVRFLALTADVPTARRRRRIKRFGTSARSRYGIPRQLPRRRISRLHDEQHSQLSALRTDRAAIVPDCSGQHVV